VSADDAGANRQNSHDAENYADYTICPSHLYEGFGSDDRAEHEGLMRLPTGQIEEMSELKKPPPN
jgi:hypothetical protein